MSKKPAVKKRKLYHEASYLNKVARAKRRVRSRLDVISGWTRWNFAQRALPPPIECSIDRVDASQVSKKLFIKKYIKTATPCLIENAMNDWPAMKSWSVDQLRNDVGELAFRVGDSDSGKSVRLKMKHYLDYCISDAPREDSPLYIFDPAFGKPKKNQRNLRLEYSVPDYFKDDLFELIDSSRRPPYRWIVLGPQRSGSNMHVDPLGTGAWNSVISGSKRWVLFPPHVPKIKLTETGKKTFDSEGVSWFHSVWSKMTEKEKSDLGAIEFVQKAGETVFVPGGWWHVVVNLEFTVAVTQNFAPYAQVDYIWLKTRNSRPKMARRLLKSLDQRALAETDKDKARAFKKMAKKVRALKYVPGLEESSDSSSSSSDSSTDISVSSTSSDSDKDGKCNCAACKRKQKRALKRQQLGLKKPNFCLYGPWDNDAKSKA